MTRWLDTSMGGEDMEKSSERTVGLLIWAKIREGHWQGRNKDMSPFFDLKRSRDGWDLRRIYPIIRIHQTFRICSNPSLMDGMEFADDLYRMGLTNDRFGRRERFWWFRMEHCMHIWNAYWLQDEDGFLWAFIEEDRERVRNAFVRFQPDQLRRPAVHQRMNSSENKSKDNMRLIMMERAERRLRESFGEPIEFCREFNDRKSVYDDIDQGFIYGKNPVTDRYEGITLPSSRDTDRGSRRRDDD